MAGVDLYGGNYSLLSGNGKEINSNFAAFNENGAKRAVVRFGISNSVKGKE